MIERPAVIVGARPNFMKVAPLIRALRARDVQPSLVHTGQHYDEAMSGTFFASLGLPQPDVNLEVGSGTHGRQTAVVLERYEAWLERSAPDCTIVVGDVNSTVACSLASVKLGIPVAHVEAGLRSFDRTMPEEINRVIVDAIATWLFAPSPDAVLNLRAEGVEESRIHLVGNVMADSLFSSLDLARAQRPRERLQLPKRFGLMTLHRPALVDDPDRLIAVVKVLGELGTDLPFVFPVHPRTRANLERSAVNIDRSRLVVCDPLDYLDFLALEELAAVVVTDSGGVQEETSLLGTPCITLRETTERPVTVTSGTNVLVGLDVGCLPGAVVEALTMPRQPARIPLWDGAASERIAAILTGSPPEVGWIPPRRREDGDDEFRARTPYALG